MEAFWAIRWLCTIWAVSLGPLRLFLRSLERCFRSFDLELLREWHLDRCLCSRFSRFSPPFDCCKRLSSAPSIGEEVAEEEEEEEEEVAEEEEEEEEEKGVIEEIDVEEESFASEGV